MIPRSLSASSALVYESCPARWRAEYQERAPQPSGDAALLGTACHAALERWVAEGWYQKFPDGADALAGEGAVVMDRLYGEEHDRFFTHQDRYEEGLNLCLMWMVRQDWEGRTVLSTEKKMSFDLKTSVGPIPFNYIWDRCDRLESGDIEVVDYKTVSAPIQPDHLKRRIQARAYALAAQIAFPEAKRIWVTFDLLRFDPIGIVFTREENIATWHYLRALAERIIASDGTEENLNAECRYCVRRHNCETLNRHAAAGGHLGITDPNVAAERRLHLESAKKAIETMLSEMDEVILAHCEHEEVLGFSTSTVEVEITARRTRTVDSASVARVVGPELVAATAKLGVTALDAMLKAKDSPLTDAQKSELRQLIRYQHGEPSVRVKPRAAVGAE